MPRIRTIKPEFFTHEGLGDLPFHERLAFIGLWTLADVAGRLEDRPKRIKAEIFPYDDVDMDEVLTHLDQTSFIRRYNVDGRHLIQIDSLPRHQHFTGKEAKLAPKYPGPDGRESPGKQQGTSREVTGKQVGSQDQVSGIRYQVSGNKEQGSSRGVPWKPNGSPSPAAGFSFHDDAEMIATAVIDQIGVTTKWGRDQIVKQAEHELSSTAETDKPATMDELRDAMVLQWKRYREAVRIGKTKTDMGAEKFFGEARWKNSSEWGLKKGESLNGIVV